jgi:acetoacetyl-CoA reductase
LESAGREEREKELKKKVVLITGGVGGIGTGVSKTLAAKGYFVVANFVVPGSETRWHDEMRQAGFNGDATATAFGDVSDYGATGEMVRKIEAEIGPIDVLVNCAGITRDSTLRKMTPEHWHAVLSTNLTSVFNASKHVIDGMVERGWGRIINISSVNGTKGQFGQTNYAAAKAGVLGFTKSLAQEVIKKGVTVNAVSPGYIDTDMTRAIRKDIREQIVDSIPAGRMGLPQDIANAIAFLASDDSSYITGANISVNGGLHMYS